MGSTIEKNDVDISKLFNYGDKFTLTDRKGKPITTVFIRLVGDAELNRARVFALRCSADLRSKLKDLNSEENKAYMLRDYTDLSKQNLIDMISSYSYQTLAKEAVNLTNVPLPKEPVSDALLEEHEKYQKEVDEYPLLRLNSIKAKMDELLNNLRIELDKKDKKALVEEYEIVYIANLCEQEMLDKFREMCAYFGCYKDKNYKTRMFSSYEEFENLLPDIKKQIIENYSSVELNSDELKK
jgi:hypothetical protein